MLRPRTVLGRRIQLPAALQISAGAFIIALQRTTEQAQSVLREKHAVRDTNRWWMSAR